jgi:hypothetical protein
MALMARPAPAMIWEIGFQTGEERVSAADLRTGVVQQRHDSLASS